MNTIGFSMIALELFRKTTQDNYPRCGDNREMRGKGAQSKARATCAPCVVLVKDEKTGFQALETRGWGGL